MMCGCDLPFSHVKLWTTMPAHQSLPYRFLVLLPLIHCLGADMVTDFCNETYFVQLGFCIGHILPTTFWSLALVLAYVSQEGGCAQFKLIICILTVLRSLENGAAYWKKHPMMRANLVIDINFKQRLRHKGTCNTKGRFNLLCTTRFTADGVVCCRCFRLPNVPFFRLQLTQHQGGDRPSLSISPRMPRSKHKLTFYANKFEPILNSSEGQWGITRAANGSVLI